MKPGRFRYHRPSGLDEALGLIAGIGDAGAVLAGGQSLLPMLNLRAFSPDDIVDIGRVDELRGIQVVAGGLRIGALTTYAELERSPLVARHAPLLITALSYVAHTAIRNRGTVGGSVALADPAAELPACLLALDATIVLQSAARGRRKLATSDFFQGTYLTARAGDELVVEVEIPCSKAQNSWFGEISRRRGDFAAAGLILNGQYRDERFRDLRIVVFAIADRPLQLHAVSQTLEGKPFGPEVLLAAQEAMLSTLQPDDQLHYSGAARRQLMKTLLARGLGGFLAGKSEIDHV